MLKELKTIKKFLKSIRQIATYPHSRKKKTRLQHRVEKYVQKDLKNVAETRPKEKSEGL